LRRTVGHSGEWCPREAAKDKGSGYEILDPGSAGAGAGRHQQFSRAILSPWRGRTPLFNIGKQDTIHWTSRAEVVRAAKAMVRWIPGAQTSAWPRPWVAPRKSLRRPHGHKYNTPGANDNTASLICVLMLARHVRQPPHRTVSFVATAGEKRATWVRNTMRRAESERHAHRR
jgi:hypothetical protein